MIDNLIQTTVQPIIPVCEPLIYSGEAMEYCVYTYTETPDSFGDNEPDCIVYRVQLHWLFPWEPKKLTSSDVQQKKRALRDALFDAGFTFPTIQATSDGEWIDVVFECENTGEV